MNPNEILWQPSDERIKNANITKFSSQYSLPSDYNELHQWTLDNPEEFWSKFWDFANLLGEKGERIIKFADNIYDTQFFPDAKFNYCENMLRVNDDRIAIISCNENDVREKLTFKELQNKVANFAKALKNEGVKQGDCVAGIVANTSEPIIAMLATQSLGAIWTSCSPDFGTNAIIDRFGQIQPKILIACNAYSYNQKVFDLHDKLVEVTNLLNETNKVIIYRYEIDQVDLTNINHAIAWDDFIGTKENLKIEYTRTKFSDPGFILYSSGTTGKPKCIVHSAAGILLKQINEQILHYDVKENEKMLYFTTCGWMMWNWQLSIMPLKATMVIFDGSPFSATPHRLINLLEEFAVEYFGMAPKYFSTAETMNLNPVAEGKLKKLKTIITAGSALLPQHFEYIYKFWGKDIHLTSISGGSDICSLFVGGAPTLPVKKSCIQNRQLGCDIVAYNEVGEEVLNESGELICKNAIPSMPIGFLHDDNKQRYKDAYYNKFPNVWTHGDWTTIFDDGHVIISGRSDATLNPGGVRIGTADIYSIVDSFAEVDESLAVGKDLNGDEVIILFIKLVAGNQLTEDLIKRIKQQLRTKESVRHVPYKIFAVSDFPRTRSGKTAELIVKAIINNKAKSNTQGLANPEVLTEFAVEIT